MYTVRGRNAATAATADHAVWQLWNPHATQRIKLIQWAIFAQSAAPAAGWSGRLKRTTAIGTAGSTVTPDIDNHSERAIAPPSGALLHLAAFTVQPTLDASELGLGFTFAAVQASGIVAPIPGGLIIPPGTGIAFVQIPATASVVFEVSVSWLEDWM